MSTPATTSTKSYIAVLHDDDRMGGPGPSYRFLSEAEVGSIKLYGEYVRLYKLLSPDPLPKEQAKQLGLRFLSDRDKPVSLA